MDKVESASEVERMAILLKSVTRPESVPLVCDAATLEANILHLLADGPAHLHKGEMIELQPLRNFALGFSHRLKR